MSSSKVLSNNVITKETIAPSNNVITKQTTTILKQLKPVDFQTEKTNLTKYFKLDTWHYLIIIGIAVSGLAAFIATYDAISNINNSMEACAQSPALQNQLNTQFIVLLAISCFAILLGLALAWFFRTKGNHRLVSLGILTSGILGVIYALSIKFQGTSNNLKLLAAWVVFIGFLLLGWFLSNKQSVSVTNPLTWE